MKSELLQRAAILSLLFLSSSIAIASDLPKQVQEAGYNDLVFGDEFNELVIDDSEKGPWFTGLWYQRPFDKRLVSPIEEGAELSSLASITTLSRSAHHGLIFKYGYFSARIKLTLDPDNWGAFWLFSAQKAADDPNVRHWCEIDVFENFKKNYLTGTLHDWKDEKHTGNNADLTHRGNDNYMQKIEGGFDVSNWNTYGVLWQPKKVTWFLNGRAVMNSPSPSICDEQEMFVILSAQSHSGKTSQKLAVDWVRVYGIRDKTIRKIGF